MKNKLVKRIILSVTVGVMAFALVGCKSKEETSTTDKKELNIGVSAGPYNDLFNEAIQPILEKQGYTINKVDFSDLLQSEVALTEGTVDFNVAQHTAYTNNFNKEKNAELVAITPIPTVPAGIFSTKHTSLDEVKEGQIVAIPQDPSNKARAFSLLEKAGWIKLKEGVEKTVATENDIVENKYNVTIKPMDSLQIPRSLQDIDYAIIPGSVVYAAKIDAKTSLLSEDVAKNLELVVVVNKGNEDSEWAKAIVAAYKSDELKKYMEEHNKDNYWFIPAELK